MVVLSIIGGAAFMFNTAMLKGAVRMGDINKGTFSGISVNQPDTTIEVPESTGTVTAVSTGIPSLYVNKLGTETIEIDWDSGTEINLGTYAIHGTVDMTISDFELYIDVPESYPISDYFSQIFITQNQEGLSTINRSVYANSSNTLDANAMYKFTVSGVTIPGIDFSAHEGKQVSMIVNKFVTTDGVPYTLAAHPGSYFFDLNQATVSGYTYGGYTLTSAEEDAVEAPQPAATYSNTITVTDENGELITDLTESDFSIAMNTTTISDFANKGSGIYLITLADGTAASYTLLVSPDGYVVDGLPYNEGYGSATIYDDKVYTASVVIDHGYTIFPVDSSGAAVSGADVTITDGTCIEYLTTGGYYCLVTTLNSAPTYTIIATGFENFSKIFDEYRTYPVSATISESPELTAGSSEPAAETPDTEETGTTGGLEFAFKELVSGTGLTAKLSTEDLHFYSSADSSTEVEATVELISAPKGKTTMGATLPEGEYTVTVSPEGYVSQEFGPYITAENVFLADANFEKLEYGYYVHILNDANTSTVIANTVVECDSLGDGYYGCAIPLSVSIPNFTVSNGEYADYSASFTTVRDEAADPSETAEMSLGDSSPLTGDDWVIPISVTDSIGQVIEGLTESNFDLGDQTLTAVEDLLDGNYYLFVENGDGDSYDVTINLTGYVSNTAAYDSVDFEEIAFESTVNEITLEFTHYLRLLDAAGAIITGGKITAGDNFAVECLDFSILTTDYDGFYACGVPSTDSSTLFNVSATGYDDYEGDFATEGTLDAEGYVTVDVTLTSSTTEDTDADAVADDVDADDDNYTSENDCNDADSTVYETSTYHLDADGDGYGDSTTGVEICSATTPSGYVATGTDCSDTDATVYTNQTYYYDADSDGYGDYSTYVSQCTMTAPTGYVTNSTDTSDAVVTTTATTSTSSTDTTATTSSSSSSSSASTTSTTAATATTNTSSSATKSEILSDPDYVCNTSFYDIIGHWGYNGICRLYKAGIVNGKTSTTFAPNDYITRAEFLKIALGNAGYTVNDATGLSETMLDVNDSDWYSPWIKIAENKGFLGNGGVNWYPNALLYRKDAVVIAVRIAKQTLYGFTQNDINFTDVFVSDYFAYAVILMNNTTVEGSPIISGYSNGQFGGSYHMTRAEVSAMIIRAYLAWYN